MFTFENALSEPVRVPDVVWVNILNTMKSVDKTMHNIDDAAEMCKTVLISTVHCEDVSDAFAAAYRTEMRKWFDGLCFDCKMNWLKDIQNQREGK